MESHKRLHLKTFLMIGIIVLAGPLGNVLLGKGMKTVGAVTVSSPSDLLHLFIRVFTTGSIWLGIASLLTFFLAYMLVLSWADYSYVQPASSFAYAVVAILSVVLLGEAVSPVRWLGIAIICLGVFVVGQTHPSTTEKR
jgi:drug/metabolite transporter (DMT)-like permease